MDLGKNLEWGNLDIEKQICYKFTYMWMLALKLLITKLQSIYLQNLHKEKGLGVGMNHPRRRNGISSYS